MGLVHHSPTHSQTGLASTYRCFSSLLPLLAAAAAFSPLLIALLLLERVPGSVRLPILFTNPSELHPTRPRR